jgi:hypothetical protein
MLDAFRHSRLLGKAVGKRVIADASQEPLQPSGQAAKAMVT